MNDNKNEPKRRRGIQASRTKLRQALVNAGIKTQAELADRVAKLEGLETPPRKLINKLFRGEPVDPLSLERVARALNIEAWQIYRTADEPEEPIAPPSTSDEPEDSGPPDLTESEEPPPVIDAAPAARAAPAAPALDDPPRELPARKPRDVRLLYAALGVAALVLSASIYQGLRPAPSSETHDTAFSPLDLGEAVAVLPLQGERGEAAALALEKALASRWKILPGASIATAGETPRSVLERRKVDAVMTVESKRVGRYLALRLQVHTSQAMRHVWTEVIPAAAAQAYLDLRMRVATQSLGLTGKPGAAGFPSPAAEERVLNGQAHNDKARTEQNTLRALAEFESAVRLAPSFAGAHAGLCASLLSESVRTGNVVRLDEAEIACRRALELDGQQVDAVRSHANLLRKRGKLAEAVAGLEKALELDPDNVDARLAMAEIRFVEFSTGKHPDSRQAALELLHRAREIEPRYWKTPFTLARIHYAAGEVEEAIRFQREAAELDPSMQTLGNLGAYQFCAGHFPNAREAFVSMQALAPTEYMAYAQMASVDYVLRDFPRAADGFDRAIRIHKATGDPDMYQLWGNWGDALRMAGHAPESKAAYTRAVELVDLAVGKGDGNPVHRAYRAVYHASLARLDSSYLNGPLRVSLIAELDELATSPNPEVGLQSAIAYAHLEEHRKARALIAAASTGCPGYAAGPEFDGIAR
jgi:tetratricopeptide (TPR) repeat protein